MGTNRPLRLGFIGAGNIASAVVEGFCMAQAPSETSCESHDETLCEIWVSPRNEVKAKRLAERFPHVTRASSNQDVLDQCDIVFIALRPTVAPSVLEGLTFRPDHTVVSLVPLIPKDTLATLVHPAPRVYKALTLPYVARHLGEIPYYPQDPSIEPLLSRLCKPVPMANERELHLLWATTGLISLFYALMQATQGWCVEGGTDPEVARRYTASMYASLAQIAASSDLSFQTLASEAATPGGLNEMALRMMQGGTMFPDFRQTIDAILERFGEAPVEAS